MHTGKTVAQELREALAEAQKLHEKLAVIGSRHQDTMGGRSSSRAESALRAVIFLLEHDPSEISERNSQYLASKLLNGVGEFRVVVRVGETQTA